MLISFKKGSPGKSAKHCPDLHTTLLKHVNHTHPTLSNAFHISGQNSQRRSINGLLQSANREAMPVVLGSPFTCCMYPLITFYSNLPYTSLCEVCPSHVSYCSPEVATVWQNIFPSPESLFQSLFKILPGQTVCKTPDLSCQICSWRGPPRSIKGPRYRI